jgi:hypothetical protein
MRIKCCLTVVRAQVAKHAHTCNKTVGLLRRFETVQHICCLACTPLTWSTNKVHFALHDKLPQPPKVHS